MCQKWENGTEEEVRKLKKLEGDVPGGIWWTIWRERNLRRFEGKNSRIQKIKLDCILLLDIWCKQEYINDSEIILQFLESV